MIRMMQKQFSIGGRIAMAITVCAWLVLGATGSLSAQTWVPVWTDTFTGPSGSYPSTNDWTYEQNGNGEGNAELEYYCPPTDNSFPCSTSNPNVYEDGKGDLVIRAIDNGGTWTSARMNTSGHHDIQYGRFEATMLLPAGAGLWPAWWMLGEDIGSVGWPACGEIDIMENIPAMGQNTIQSSLHGANGYNTGNQTGLSSSDGNWHTYGVNWWPGNVQFYVDNYQTPFATLTPSSSGGTWEFDNGPFFMLLNLAVGGNWPGPPNGSTPNPAYMLVNKVEVLQYCAAGITNLGCNNGTPVNGSTSGGGTGGGGGGGGGVSIGNGTYTLTPQNATGMRLDDEGARTTQGNGIDIYAANGTAAQNWAASSTNVVPAGDYNFSTLGSYCLTASGTASGSAVVLDSCNGSSAQAWQAVKSGNNYNFHPANNTGNCLDVRGAGTTNGTVVQVYTCNGTAAQAWAL
jgi:beta-glucanase (GH16 family)